jgi:hypothetical protein
MAADLKDFDEGLKFKRLQEAVHNVLKETLAGGNGGYYAQFGPVTFTDLITFSEFDMEAWKKRKKL